VAESKTTDDISGARNQPLEELPAGWWEPLVQVSLDGQFVLRPVDDELSDFEVLYSNESGARLGGTTPEAVVGRLLSEIAPPYGAGLRKALLEAAKSGLPVHRTTERIAPGVHTRRAEFRVQPFDGLLAMSVIDRTDEYDAEELAAALNGQLMVSNQNSPTAFALLRPVRDSSGTVVDVCIEQANNAAASLLGRTPDEVLGKTLYSLVSRPFGSLAKLVHDCLETQRTLTVDWDFRELTTQADWLRIQVSPLGALVVLHADDISPERREQETLRDIIDHAGEIVIFTDVNGSIRYINPFACATLGFTELELVNSSILALAHPDDRPAVLEETVALLKGTPGRNRRRIRVFDVDGNVLTMLGSPMAVRAVGGEINGVLTIATDITDLLASEEAREELAAELSMAEQRERERLADELHDGPVQDLTALSMKIGAAIRARPNPELLAAEDLVTKVIGDLRTLMFRLTPPELDGDELGQAIHQRAEHLFAGTGVRVQVQGKLSPAPSPALTVTLFRIAQEALFNSFKHAAAQNVAVRLFDSPGRDMVLEVTDDGCGADRSRYQLQVAGHFGLTMMQDRTLQMGGTFSVKGAPNKGTVVTVSFPRSSISTS
jgi:PAS domain S-box-containing protein